MASGDVNAFAVISRRRGVELRYPWPHSVGDGELFRSIQLAADTPFEDVGTIVATLCDFNGVAPARCALMPIARMVRIYEERRDEPENWIVSGGIEVWVDGELVLGPACCCGLETWREWLAFVEGGAAPWSGHDPDPIIARTLSGAIELGTKGGPSPAQVAPYALRAALLGAERDLRAFVEPLSSWADRVVPRLAASFVSAFVETMLIAAVQ